MKEEQSKEIITVNNEVASWGKEKWDRVLELFVPKGVKETDKEIFFELSKAYNLNPFKKEIWIIPYGDKSNIFCGRDGFLSIAHRSGQFNGMETTFEYDKTGKLLAAECVVYNKSCDYPIKCKVLLNEYSSNRGLWLSKPHVMLQKVAESSALRRAFNVSGLYAPEEFPDEHEIRKNKKHQETKEIEYSNPIDDPLYQEKEELQKGNFNEALKLIEASTSVETLEKIQDGIKHRRWEKEELSFMESKISEQLKKIKEN